MGPCEKLTPLLRQAKPVQSWAHSPLPSPSYAPFTPSQLPPTTPTRPPQPQHGRLHRRAHSGLRRALNLILQNGRHRPCSRRPRAGPGPGGRLTVQGSGDAGRAEAGEVLGRDEVRGKWLGVRGEHWVVGGVGPWPNGQLGGWLRGGADRAFECLIGRVGAGCDW